MLSTIGYVLLGIGVGFEILGCIGLIRLPDVYDRAVAATKCVTMGTCMLLAGTACFAADWANWSMMVKAIICGVFVLLTSPVAAHAVLRGAYLSGVHMADAGAEDAFAQRAQKIRQEFKAAPEHICPQRVAQTGQTSQTEQAAVPQVEVQHEET